MLIDAIAPSHLCTASELCEIERIVASRGHDLHLDASLVTACEQGATRLATDVARKHIQTAIETTATRADVVWAVRGGYGASRLVPALLQLPKPKMHTWFVGSSDATVLHIFLNQRWGWRTIHGVMLARNSEMHAHTRNPTNAATSLDTVLDLITQLQQNSQDTAHRSATYRYPMTPLNPAAVRTTKHYAAVQGKLVGGNLSILCATLGTHNHCITDSAIVLIEEVNETAERIERMLEQLQQANLLSQASAVCFGQLDGTNETTVSCHLPLLIDFINSLSVPCYHLRNVGHGSINLPLVLGARHSISYNAGAGVDDAGHTRWLAYDDTN